MPSSHATERQASLQRDLEEVKFWCHSIGIKNLRDCITDAPRSVVAFDRQEALRELTTCDWHRLWIPGVLETPKDPLPNTWEMKGIINDVWSCIESLLREAYSIAKPGTRVELALGFVCNSGRHRSVCISEMTAAGAQQNGPLMRSGAPLRE